MKKLNLILSKLTPSNRIFTLSVFLFYLFGLSLSASQPEYFIMEEISQDLNLLQLKKFQLMNGYNQISIQFQNETPNLNNSTENFPTNSEQFPPTAQNSQESSAALQDLLSLGGNLFETLDNQLAELQEQLTNSETTISGLQTLLLQSNETITQLSGNLTKAQKWSDQIEDQLQANNTDLAAANEHLNLLSQQNAAWKNEALTLQKQIGKTNFIAFGFGAAGFAIGTPLITEGIHSDNQAMLWAGTGTIIGTTGIWLLGHYMFHWW